MGNEGGGGVNGGGSPFVLPSVGRRGTKEPLMKR
jgi:hypothetical protein